jgi:hypothetical protein
VKHGVQREAQIANALRQQAGIPLLEATGDEDKIQKVDRWVNYPTGRVALQIKYRESGKDLLFEVYDKFFGWDHPNNKLGRDMFGDATEYAVLLRDRKTVVLVPTASAKKVINTMVEVAQRDGWTHSRYWGGATLNYRVFGVNLELKVQNDPGDGRQKMVAYIPADYFRFLAQSKVYEIALPKRWQD